MKTSDFILPLHVHGLNGRVLHIPGPAKTAREILFIYGHHSSIERWEGIAKLASQHYTVTMPDLPGFGGMDSLYKIGKTATIDNLADFLAAFVAQRYAKKQITIVGMSLGFVVATRMLQRHPHLTKNVHKLISLFGFAHHDDFVLPARQRAFYLHSSRLFSLPVTSDLYRLVALHPAVLRKLYHRTRNAREKFKNLNAEQHRKQMDFEVKLWRTNDLRTQMKTSAEFLRLNNTTKKINLPVYHIGVQADRFFDNARVKAHFEQIFSQYHELAMLSGGNHAPTRVQTAEQAKALFTPELLQSLA